MLTPDPVSGLGVITLDSFEIPPDGNLSLELIQTTVPDLSFLVDFQRNYGRTVWQNEVFPGELVCRWRFWSDDKPAER